jgi:hypothetical protein
LENWKTPLSYSIAVPLNNDGIYYQFVLELVAPLDTVSHNKALGTDHVLSEQSTRINGVRIYVKHPRAWIAGADVYHVRHAWDPFLEYRPVIPREVNKVPIPPKENDGVIEKVGEFMRNLRIPAVSPEFNSKECSAAELIEFEALSDDQDIRPINEALVNEMFGRLVTNPFGHWKHDHNAPTMLVLIKRHSLGKCYKKIRQAMWGQTKELAFDRKIHPNRAGHNPRQSYRPVPTKWLEESSVSLLSPMKDASSHLVPLTPWRSPSSSGNN